MINVSNAFKEKLEDGEPVRMTVDITFDDGTKKTVDEDIMNGANSFSDCAESSSFPVGIAVCKALTLNINNDQEQWKNYNFYGAKIHAYLKLQTSYAAPESVSELLDENYNPILDSAGDTILATQAATKDVIETVDKGIYTVTTPEQYSDIITITALDDMYKANKTYTSGLKLPQSLINLVRDACETIGIGMNLNMEHGDIIIRSIPDNMTFRQLFGYAAMVEAANARIDYSGNLRFIKWDFEKTDISDLRAYGNPPTLSSDDIVITGIKVKNGQSNDDTDTEYSGMYGEEGYVLELENELIDTDQLETVANIIGEQLVGAQFRNLEGDLAYNPLVEFGDMVYSYDRLGNKYLTPLTDVSGNVGGLTTVKTQADDPIRGSSDYYSGETKAIVAARQMVKKETSAREDAIKRLNTKLDSASGMYVTDVEQADGSTVRYFHDKPTLAESQNVIKITAEAIGFSNDGGKTYPYGITLDGETITKILYAEGINADYINAGTLLVKDKDGNAIFEADMDTGSVTIDGSYVVIGGKNLSEKLTDVENTAAMARNMTLQLSNDYQGIPVDSDGEYTTFPDCITTATVMYGTQDITNSCTYTITTSQNVQGSWNNSTKTYTVTGLTADSGWVNVRAVYLNSLAVSKQFSLAKQYAGPQGTAARTYFFQSNAEVLLMGADKKLTPAPLIVDSFYRDGNEDAQSQKGWWKLEKTSDNGATWSALTVSQSAALDRLSVNVNSLSLNAHDMLKVSLYLDQSKTKLADYQTFSVAVDVAALTHEMIFNLLTDDGAIKGIYKEGDQLYISFTYAKGGTLALGGANNGNGQMRVYDANGKLVARLGNTGLIFNKNVNTDNPVPAVTLNTVGLRLFTDYTDNDNYKALIFGKYGLYATTKDNSVEELWLEGDTSKKWEGYIIRYLSNKVRINTNSLFTDGCELGANLSVSGNATVDGTFTFYDLENQEKTSGKVKRQPVASVSAEGSRVAYLNANRNSNKQFAVAIRGQYGATDGYTTWWFTADNQSDVRLKENFAKCKINALEAVLKMPICSFDWKESGIHQPLGLVADEIEKIDPLLVSGGGYNEDGSINAKQVDRLLLTEYAIKAIQELSAKVEAQDKRIKELERRLQDGQI